MAARGGHPGGFHAGDAGCRPLPRAYAAAPGVAYQSTSSLLATRGLLSHAIGSLCVTVVSQHVLHDTQ